jgi:NADH-quinone oxidoreductase subunit N
MAKFYVFVSAAQVGLFWLVGIGVINSVISVYYYLRVVLVMYVGEGPAEPLRIDRHAAFALAIALTGVLALGILPETAMTAAAHAAAVLFGG